MDDYDHRHVAKTSLLLLDHRDVLVLGYRPRRPLPLSHGISGFPFLSVVADACDGGVVSLCKLLEIQLLYSLLM